MNIIEQIPNDVAGEASIESSKEKKEKMHEIIVDLIRHGQASYDGELRPEDKKETIQFEGALTEEGQKTIEDTATKIVEKIGDNELVYLWSSPRQRTRESMEIIKRVLEENEIDVFPKSKLAKTVDNLSDLGLTGEFLEEFSKRENIEWMDYWKDEAGSYEGVEDKEEFLKRIQGTISRLQQFALNVPVDRKIRFVCLTHEEEIKNIAEQFGISVEIVKNGEIMEMKIDPKEDKPSKLSIKTQGQEVERSSDQLFKPGV